MKSRHVEYSATVQHRNGGSRRCSSSNCLTRTAKAKVAEMKLKWLIDGNQENLQKDPLHFVKLLAPILGHDLISDASICTQRLAEGSNRRKDHGLLSAGLQYDAADKPAK